MALLHYANVEEHRPDVLMGHAFYGLTPFYQFLKRTQEYLDSEGAVRRVGWEVAGGAKQRRTVSEASDGVWIRLVEPPKTTSSAGDVQAFMDDGCKDVYEAKRARSPNPVAGETFDPQYKISVLDRDVANQRLKIERMPRCDRPELVIRANTWPIHCQLQAIRHLQNAPWPMHRPLLRLFEKTDHARWPDIHHAAIEESAWAMLTEADRPGTAEQRRFVEVALATPDFALLEGPPGSGKTTVICELILQLVKQGKRVLLTASTHVAVDNVLERLMDDDARHGGAVIPVRIGDDSKVSERVSKWRLDQFVKTELKRLRGAYRKLRSLSPSQRAMRDALGGNGQGHSVIERLILEAANVVCGTSIGILQHPDLERKDGRPQSTRLFDVLIVDEASKTTFQEFLVPALLAKRWTIVGDPKQLSPYVDEDEMAVNLRACLPDETARNACIDAFEATRATKRRRGAVVVAKDDHTREIYATQGQGRGATVVDIRHANRELPFADIVVGDRDELERCLADLPLDTATLRGAADRLDVLHRRVRAWCSLTRRDGEAPRWEQEVAWRLARLHDLRFAKDHDRRASKSGRLDDEVQDLLPVSDIDTNGATRQSINSVRHVALPSVLESLRCGFDQHEGRPAKRPSTAMSDGLPEPVLAQRMKLLTTQHRMHPVIAAFPHEHIYDGEALRTPPGMEAERNWEYRRFRHRSVWIDVRGVFDARTNSNSDECRTVLEELRQFERWAEGHPRPDGDPWEAAVLTFYRGQERAIRSCLRRTGRHQIQVDICTVDRFQGHEADIVFISFANRHSTSFLESPNRLNVALTRARYQRVIVGNRRGLARSRSDLLRTLAEHEPWNTKLEKD